MQRTDRQTRLRNRPPAMGWTDRLLFVAGWGVVVLVTGRALAWLLG